MTNIETYREICKSENTIPIFFRDWWLDVVCGKNNWDVLLYEKDGVICGILPYYIKNRFGLSYITMPKLTPTGGLWIKYPVSQKYEKKLSYEKEIMLALIDQLEKLPIKYYRQNFNYTITNWLPFYWRGYKQTTAYTYRIDNVSDYSIIRQGFNSKIRSTEKNKSGVIIKRDEYDIIVLHRLLDLTFQRQNAKSPISLDLLVNLNRSLKAHNCCALFTSEDENGEIHSAAFFIWDDITVYYLVGGENPKYRSSNSPTLLVLEGIKLACSLNLSFDFEGSIIEGIEKFFRSFGGHQTQIFALSKIFTKNPVIKYFINKRI